MKQELREVFESAYAARAFADGVLTAPDAVTPVTIEQTCRRLWSALDGLGLDPAWDKKNKDQTVSDMRFYRDLLDTALWVAEEVVHLEGIQ